MSLFEPASAFAGQREAKSRGALHERGPFREIARLTDANRSTVLEALDRFGMPKNGIGHKGTGHLPFGFDYLNHQLVKNGGKQAAIRMMR